MENFGKKAKDKITDFEGIITAKCFYIYGCAQYLITPKVNKEGKKEDGFWVDEGRVIIMKEEIKPEDVKVERGGCELREHPNI